MNNDRQDAPPTGIMAPLVGFALGAVVGGVLALLLAPASGERTRRRIGTAALRLGRNARHTYEEARDTVSEVATGFGDDVKAAIVAGREAFQKDGTAHEGAAATRAEHLPNLPSVRKM